MSITISVFESARVKIPRSETLPFDDLARKLSRFRVRPDIPLRITADLAIIDRLVAGEQVPGWLGDRFRERLAKRPNPDAVGRELASQVPRQRKAMLLAWSPTRYPPEATRCTDNVLDVSALVLDIDDGATLDQIWSLWPDHPRVLHTSWSHTTDHPKARLVVPLAEPTPRVGWERVWAHARIYAGRRGVKIDEKCSNPDRLYFAPAVPADSSPRESRIQLAGQLLTLRWQDLVDPTAARRAARIASRPPPPRRPDGWQDFTDPVERERIAVEVDARLLGSGGQRRADRIPCPSCGRASVYFYVEPSRSGWARCDHKNSCSWAGPLVELRGLACSRT